MDSICKSGITHDASGGFNFYGRWETGVQAVSINSGSMVEFAYTGGHCTLYFDVQNFTHYPAVFLQVDEGPVCRTTLSCNVSTVPAVPEYNILPDGQPPFSAVSSGYHIVRFWIACHSLYNTPASGQQWTTLNGGCKFIGVNLNGGDIVSLPYCSRQIEFLGDSITQGLRLLYTGLEEDTGNQMPYANWPQLVANMLCMKPVVTGFGGQGLSASGTCGAPPANAAFPYIYNNTEWHYSIPPEMVVIYHGTNDKVSPLEFENLYSSYLTTIRKAYPDAVIFAICPHDKINYAGAIQNAVNSLADRKVWFLDYSAGIISPSETCDSRHLNPGGAIKLASAIAKDIAKLL